MRASLAISATLLGALVLSGCGGGGGSEPPPPASPAPPPTTSPPPPPSPPPPFVFTAASALEAGAYVLSGVEQALLAAQYVSSMASLLSVPGRQELIVTCGGTSYALRYVDNDANSQISSGDTLRMERPQCANHALDLSFTVDTITTAPAKLTGQGTLDLTAGTPAMRVEGSFALTYTRVVDTYQWSLSELDLTVTRDGVVETVAGDTIEKSLDAMNRYLTTFSGSIDSSRWGVKVDFETPVALEGTAGAFPSAGEVVLTAGSSKIRITPTSDQALGDTYADLAIDESGAGYAAAQTPKWLELLLGSLFGWFKNDPPVITSLSIDPVTPTSADQLQAVYVASDPEGVTLQPSFAWSVNGVPVLSGPFANILWPGPFAKGDKVDVTLTVSDGRKTANATASVTIANGSPAITMLTITPADPDTTDDLTANYVAYDPDGDVLAFAHVWRVNGAVVDGQTGLTLPASAHKRDDVVTVEVSAADDAATVSLQTSTTILDAPAFVHVASPPGAAAFGSLVQFEATVDDPDGDTIGNVRFELTHGPAGMTVDPVTGNVTWLAQPPMFDRTLDVHWGITVDSANANAVEGTTTVTDAARSYALARTGFEVPLWPAGLRVGDFDGDNDEEALILSYKSLYELETDGAGGYRQSWMYPFTLGAWPEQYRPNQMSAIATGDTDGDGKHEIFVAAGDQVFKLDGAERRIASVSTSFGQNRSCLDLQLANLDATGEAELVCLLSDYYSGTRGLVALGADDLGERWRFADADYGATIDLGNVDADAALEIVTAKGYVFDGATLENEWLYGPGFGTDVDTGDLDGDGVAEIVANASALSVYSAVSKSPLWEVAVSGPTSLLVTNIDADPLAEIVVGDGQWGNVTAYECNAQCTGADVVFQISSQDHGVTAIGAGDFDHDGGLEFIWGTGASHTGEDKLVIAGRNPDIEVEWINLDPSQLDGAFTGGELAGTATVPAGPLFATASTDSGYAGTRLIRMDSATGDLDVSAEIGSNWNRVAALTVSDYDSDGVDEAFLGTSELYNGYVSVYDFFNATTEWTSPQYQFSQAAVAVAHADVTGDGSDELIAITSQGVVFVHDLIEQELVWQSTTLNGGRDVIIEDLDSDGSKDILVVTTAGLYVYERSTGPVTYLQTATYFPPTEIRDAVVTDADGDGDLDVLVLEGPSYIFAREGSVERLDASLQLLGSFDIAWRAESLFVEAGPVGARRNVIVPTGDFTGPPSELVALDAVTGKEVWRSPRLVGQVAKNSVHFVEIGGDTRLSVGTQSAMYLTR